MSDYLHLWETIQKENQKGENMRFYSDVNSDEKGVCDKCGATINNDEPCLCIMNERLNNFYSNIGKNVVCLAYLSDKQFVRVTKDFDIEKIIDSAADVIIKTIAESIKERLELSLKQTNTGYIVSINLPRVSEGVKHE